MRLPRGEIIQRRSSARRMNSSETKGASGKSAPREERAGGLAGPERRSGTKEPKRKTQGRRRRTGLEFYRGKGGDKDCGPGRLVSQ